MDVLAYAGRYDRRIVASGPVGRDGSFDLRDISVPADVTRIHVVAAIPGWAERGVEIVPREDGDAAGDVTLKDGRPFTGRVQDAEGRPVAGLRILITAMPGEPDVLPLDWIQEGVGGFEIVSGALRGMTITDGEGRYVVRGLECGGCSRAISLSPEWYLLADAANRSTVSVEPSLTAWSSATMDLRVTDATTGAPIAAFSVEGAPKDGKPWTAEGIDGRLRIAWPRSPARTDPAGIEFTVRASGYVLAIRPYPLARNESVVKAEVALRPATPADTGLVVVNLFGPGAGAAAGRITVVLRALGHPSVAARLHLGASGVDGVPVAAPAGSWDFEATLAPDEAAALRLVGRVDVVPGKKVDVPWFLPALGTLELKGGGPVWAGSIQGKTLVLREVGTGSVLRAPLGYTFLVPAGAWTISVEDEHGRVLATRPATIEPDKRTPVRFDE